jgi:hypothetical protein
LANNTNSNDNSGNDSGNDGIYGTMDDDEIILQMDLQKRRRIINRSWDKMQLGLCH